MRDYGGDGYNFAAVAPAIAAALTDGGVMCWHTNDRIVDGGYTGSSFDAALWFMREGGLRLHEPHYLLQRGQPWGNGAQSLLSEL